MPVDKNWVHVTNCGRELADDELEECIENGGCGHGKEFPPGKYVIGPPAATATATSEEIAKLGIVGIYWVEE